MNTIVPDLKVSKIHQRGNQHDMHRAHQSFTLFLLSNTSRIGSVHSTYRWVSDKFHNAHAPALMGLPDVFTQLAYRKCK